MNHDTSQFWELMLRKQTFMQRGDNLKTNWNQKYVSGSNQKWTFKTLRKSMTSKILPDLQVQSRCWSLLLRHHVVGNKNQTRVMKVSSTDMNKQSSCFALDPSTCLLAFQSNKGEFYMNLHISFQKKSETASRIPLIFFCNFFSLIFNFIYLFIIFYF